MNVKTICAATLAGLVIAGCGKKEEEKTDEMAVSVNGAVLMQSAIDADVEAIVKAQGDKIPVEQLEYTKQMYANQVVQSFIIEKVLAEKAKAGGFTVTDEDRKQREADLVKAMARMPDAPKSIEEYFKKFPLGEARARAEFENGILIDKMMKDAQAKAGKKDYAAEAKKVIGNIASNNTASLEKIKDLKARLDKVPAAELAKKFAELAKANSTCPSSQKGGDLGEFTHGQMVKEFDEVAFKLPLNKVSDPVKTQFGYHLIMVTKKVAAVAAKDDKPAEPEKVQASHILLKADAVPELSAVVNHLEKQAEREFVGNYIQNALKAAKIEASENYKRFLPAKDEPKAPVEKPTQK